MSNYDPKNIDYNEVIRYSGAKFDLSAIIDLLDKVKNELFLIAKPRTIYREDSIIIQDNYYKVPNSDMHLISNDINKKFYKIEKLLTMSATLGLEVDRKIAYYSAVDTVFGLLLDAMSNVYIENILDELEYDLREKYNNYNFTMRYSCGYGDLSIEMQPKIISFLKADKILGISVNSNYLMTPMKSVTAFIGLSKYEQNADKNPCLDCSLQGKCVKKCRRSYAYEQGRI